MSQQKPALPKGTRDFAPELMIKRQFILNTIRETFEKFGFMPLETPAMEKLNVLTGKYGEEGDRLIFKILNNGDFLKDISENDLEEGSKKVIPKISKKALRYDLTVPFARFVVMNRGNLTFPFKRYQIQPVWRGDRPQKGRYQEFYQCDADVIGTDSLICEAEIVLMIEQTLKKLGIEEFTIHYNHRQILAGVAEVIGASGQETDLLTAIDKLDKIGLEKVNQELKERGLSEEAIQKLQPFLIEGNITFEKLKKLLQSSKKAQKGLSDIAELYNILEEFRFQNLEKFKNQLNIRLARGLTYYTGVIFEVTVDNVKMGSISGGGRYDDLTSTFGLSGMSGIGFSFGVDRIFDVMQELDIFPKDFSNSTQVMFTQFGEKARKFALPILYRFREAGLNAEIYPDTSKLKKQFSYANAKNIPFVAIIGDNEIEQNTLTIKNMQKGEQKSLSEKEALLFIQENL